MKYLVKAKLKPSQKSALLNAIHDNTLGKQSVAYGEYLKNMQHARVLDDGTVCWIEICFCAVPLNEERPYWEEYFDIVSIQNAHDPKRCKDLSGKSKRACFECHCSRALEKEMLTWGTTFLKEEHGTTI